ncbi:MAG: hypothetical protein IT456_25335 [Planctomycetes bacterium]|nr:hypothetical protein [Planctomycetota bacterium]
MSGEAQRDDDPDFLDDDFIIEEDAVAKDEDLDTLFETPTPPVSAKAIPGSAANRAQDLAEGTSELPPAIGKPANARAPASGNADQDFDPSVDADDLLFTDHTQGLRPTEQFPGGKPFAEDAPTTWRADGLELDHGVPFDDERGTPVEHGLPAEVVNNAEAAFTAELDSLLHSEDEFALDADKELELIESDSLLDEGGEATDTFVLDDSGGAWQPGEEPATLGEESLDAVAGTQPHLAEASEAAAAELESLEPFEPAVAEGENGDETTEPGWEPLPGTSMDELAEVDEVSHTEPDEASPEGAEMVGGARTLPGFSKRPALVGAGVAAEAEGHDLYAESTPAAPTLFVAAPRRRGRALRLVASLAASFLVIAAGAVIVMQPDWFGFSFEPETVQNVQIQRPRIEVVVPPPPMPEPVSELPTSPTDAVKPGTEIVTPVPPVPVLEPTNPTPPVEVVSTEPTKVPTEPETTPVGTSVPPVATETVVPAPPTTEVAQGWPIVGKDDRVTGGNRSGLVRIGNDLLVGNQDQDFGKAVEGMLPGSRAFAQLHNGNYFIGSVKASSKESITLRVETGEVTLATSSISRLHELGSSDYESLQKATSGFIRLTNNNRLVGGILSGIADDHVVLEFRSNRVMLPKSAIGEVVQGEGDTDVRLGTTREEDDWLKKLVERQLGTGTAPNEPKAPAVPPAGSGSSKR